MSTPAGIDRIRRLAHHAERRIRFGRALHVGARALCAALVVAIVDVALRKIGLVGEKPARVVLAMAGAGVAAACVMAWTWRLADQAGARALDRFHGLHDRLASALAFAARPAADRTPFTEAAIEDAVRAAPDAHPAKAVPLPLPRSLGAALGLAGVLTGVLLFEVRHHVPVAHAKTIEPIEMAPDDLEDVKDFLHQLQQKDQSDDTKAAIEEFNKLVDDIANKRLDRTEAFRRMEALEQKLLTGSEADKKALEAQLEKIGDEMKKAELTKPAGEAMADSKLDQASDALHDLAKKLREQGGQIDKQKLEQMREALKKAAADAERRQQAIEQRRQELADELLKRKQRAGDAGANDEEQSLLQKKQRELERLDKDLDEQKNAGRQLDRLDRELQQAAEDLMKDMGLSAKDLDQSAEDINRMQEQQMTQQEKEELRQKLQEMRELMRQQGQGGKGQILRLKRFGRMARGQSGQGGQQGQGQGQQGDGQDGQDGQGQNGQGQQGQGGQQGGQNGQGGGQQGQNGQNGQGQGGQNGQGQGGETWIVGPNGEKLLMLSRGSGAGNGSGSGQSGSGGQGQGNPGPGWGEGHDEKVQGGATNPKMGTEDTQVQGADTGQGGSRSQVILGAAERGFSSRGYKKVYTEYHQVAEESLAKDDIPGGYRFYVKRYFQLIRPREDK
jgi:hypothetical protein